MGEGETLELGDLPPGDVQRLPGHVGGSVRNEERGGKAHISGRADASERDGGNGPPHGFLGHAAFGGFAGVPLHVHICKDLAGVEGVGPDAFSRVLDGEALGKHDEPGLADRIGAAFGQAGRLGDLRKAHGCVLPGQDLQRLYGTGQNLDGSRHAALSFIP